MHAVPTAPPPAGTRPSWTDNLLPAHDTADVSVGQPSHHQFDATELRRRLLHMLPGLLPFLLWVIPHPDPWGPILVGVFAISTLLIASNALLRFGNFARSYHETGRASVLGYAIPVLGTLFLCRGYEEVCVMTLGMLAFGDGSATLGGLLIGGWRLPWNSQKTLTGLVSFWMIGGVVVTALYWGESRPAISWATAVSVTGPIVLLAGILETLPLPGNDNLRVGLFTAAVGMLLHHFIFI